MKKIKLGMIFDSPSSYKGGINYFRNFAFALNQVTKNIKIYLFISDNFDEISLEDFGNDFKIVKLPILRRFSVLWFLDKMVFKMFKTSFMKHNIFKKFNIDIIFTFSLLQKSKNFKILFWLPDLQFLFYPQFFSKSQIISNIKLIKYMCLQCDRIILSSNSANQDLQYLMKKKINKAETVQFVSQPKFDISRDIKSLIYLQNKYNFNKPFFFLPNQFWKHKNHMVVFEAICINKPKDYLIICSGEIFDHRDPSGDYWNMIQNFIINNKLHKTIKILGSIPYDDVISLMKHSLAVINPSLFEGWSSSVEESKSIHKEIILSNIKVHLEQNPEFGYFFDPSSPQELAKQLSNVLTNRNKKKSSFPLEKQTLLFGNKISKIINEIIHEK